MPRKKNKAEGLAEGLAVGDLIQTMRNGEKIVAVITDLEGGEMKALQIAGAEFTVDQKNVAEYVE